jgi:hypothetical protein
MGLVRRVPALLERDAALQRRPLGREREQSCRNCREHQQSTQSAHVNLVWSPVANTDVGVEYIVANRRTEDGASGRLNRLQASAKYTF